MKSLADNSKDKTIKSSVLPHSRVIQTSPQLNPRLIHNEEGRHLKKTKTSDQKYALSRTQDRGTSGAEPSQRCILSLLGAAASAIFTLPLSLSLSLSLARTAHTR